jgi:pimeloyl-ACP methyl ester carboxylesterase
MSCQVLLPSRPVRPTSFAASGVRISDALGDLGGCGWTRAAKGRVWRNAGSRHVEDARGVAIVFHDKSRVTDEYVREHWALKMQANDGFTQRSFRCSPKLDGEVVGGRLAAITIPTLVVWGENDELIPLDQGRAYAAGIPGAKLVIVPECGHAASIEKPKEFLAAVSPFLN